MPVSARTAASGSRDAESSVPTSTALAPAPAKRSISFAVLTPLSAMATTSRGMSGRSRSEVSGSISRVSRFLLLTPINPRPQREREIELVAHRALRPESRCRRHCPRNEELLEARRAAQRADDHQRGRRAEGFRLENLDRFDVKILSEERHSHGRPRAGKIFVRSTKSRWLSQHRDGCGSSGFVGGNLFRQIEFRVDRAPGR